MLDTLRHNPSLQSSIQDDYNNAVVPASNGNSVPHVYNQYFQDSIAPVEEDMGVRQAFNVRRPQPVNPHNVEEMSISISSFLKEELAKANIDFHKVQAEFQRLLSIELRKNARGHQDFINKMEDNIAATSKVIKDTHGNWLSITLTVTASAVSIFGGLAGLTFMLPPHMISVATAEGLSRASMAIGNSGTALSALGGIPKDLEEGKRVIPQVELRHYQEKEEGRRQAKSGDKQTSQAAIEAQRTQIEAQHRATESILGS